ncbi:MAG: hypothetical protein ACRDBO_14660 [Lachnospiraceae bacterium]
MARGMYWTCEFGANHDHNEKCDCRKEQEEKERKIVSMYKREGTGQMVFDWKKFKA